jgi:hypothetical protein
MGQHDPGQFGARAHAQLGEDVAKMSVDGVDGQIEPLGGGLAGDALGNDLHYREFGA